MKTTTLLFFIFAFGASSFAQSEFLDLSFSVERGYYTDPFTVEISASKNNAQIYYTLDGSRPTSKSTPYTGQIAINTTTPLSAIAYYETLVSPVITHTYLFISDIIKQPQNPSGYPSNWGPMDLPMVGYPTGTRSPADYAMDATIINNPAYSIHIDEAFMAIPFVSIVTDISNLFEYSLDPETGGIYMYTGWNNLGRGWERPCSIEFYEPATGKQFQENCGIRVHGGASRRPSNSGKHSFRVSFRKMYGNYDKGKLRFPVFDAPTATQRFDHLVLRAGYNYTWVKNDENQQKYAQYVYDSFARRVQLAMGHLSSHDQFAHLFINGLYWGLYDISEKITDNFMDSYLGGADADYDVIGGSGLESGNLTAYNRMVSLAQNGNYDQLKAEDLIFFENFIDYILINFYIGNNDWAGNWFVSRSRVKPGDGFRFFCWDSENAFASVNTNKITSFGNATLRGILFGSSADNGGTDGGLMKNATFKNLFARRAGLHLLENGLLTPKKAAELYEKLCDEIDLPIILESARWGDFRSTTLPYNNTRVTYTRNNHWLPQKQALLNNYFPQRTNILIQQLKNIGITPISPPPSDIQKVSDETEIPVYFADNHLFYKIPHNGKVTLEIISPEGKKFFVSSPQNQFAGLHNEALYFLNSGIYIYRLTYNECVFTGKFIK